MMSGSWSNTEIQLIIADYFNMLSAELKGESYSKAQHRRALMPLMNNRSEGSVEFKHQNISAVLVELGQPYIKGYLPRFNYQQMLKEAIIDYLNQNLKIEDQFRLFSDKVIELKKSDFNFNRFIVEPPKSSILMEPKATYQRNPIKINYLEREQRNQKLGLLGEELVIKFEKWYLMHQGKEKLAEQVRWISKEEGDGAGFDILSRNLNGTDKYIEVKTTKLAKETPIFFSKNELDFSVINSRNFHLYRLFNFEEQAKMFMKNGALNQICRSVPVFFKGYF
jgi:hypothetical protein